MKRTRGRRILAAAMTLGASYAAAPSSAWACGCSGDESLSYEAAVARELDWVELVFTGRVVERDEETARFEVDTIWKGDATLS